MANTDPWVVHKFGGSSVADADCFRRVAAILDSIPAPRLGVVLSAFGAYWIGEGLGLIWPGGDSALLALVAAFAITAGGSIVMARSMRQGRT